MKKKNKILVVDDEPAVCGMLKKFLGKKGYEALTSLSGEDAVKIVAKQKPDVVLLDIKMPHMDGVETLQKIREIDKKIPVIMITAVKNDEIGRTCLELGAYDYITKPLGLEYLENALAVKLLNCENRFK